MKKLYFLLLCLFVSTPVLAEEPFTQEDVASIQWMNYYYFTKEDAKVPDFLKFLQRTAASHNSVIKPSEAFLGVLFASNKEKVEEWLKATTFTDKAAQVLVSALWLSGNSDKIKLVTKNVPKWAGKSPTPLPDLEVKTIADLDMMWAAFFASGNDVYIKKVIGALDDKKPLTADKAADQSTREAAERSLGNNILQHELVSRAILAEAKARKGAVKEKLDKIVADYRGKIKPLPNQKDDFSAMLIPTDIESVKQFNAPSASGVTIDQKTQVKAGEQVALNIVFSGMELGPDLKGDVTYDMEVLSPEGKVYDNFSEKNLEALKSRVPVRFRMFHVGTYPVIKFGPEDKPGKYKVNTTLHDNVGKKKITWDTEIELVK